jgi:polar amino acid transport system substrate-binding protein
MKFSVLATLAAGLMMAAMMAPRIAAADEGKCEPDKVATKYPGLAGKTIKIGADGDTRPYAYPDAKDLKHLIGIDVELAEAAFKCIGLPIEWKLGPWSGQLPAVANGQTDLMWDSLYYSPERAQAMDFVVYMKAGTGVMVAKGNPKKIKTIDDYCGLRAAAGLATIEEAKFRELSKDCEAKGKKPIDVVTSPDIPAAARLVLNDRADLLMINLGMINAFVEDNKDKVENAFTIITDIKVGVGANKKNPELEKAVEDALKVLRADGTEKKIYDKYSYDYSLSAPIEIVTK